MTRLTYLFVIFILCGFNTQAFADYVKVSNSGNALPASAVLGSGADDWACTYDDKTQLMWEVKTTDGGLRDQEWSYTWYDTNSPDGNKGSSSGYASCKTSGRCDTEKFTQDVNAQGLCGSKDWRLPDKEQLNGLVYCSTGQGNSLASNPFGSVCLLYNGVYLYNSTGHKPSIDSGYFPNTSFPAPFWSSSPDAGSGLSAWYVDFFSSGNDWDMKSSKRRVRLVRIGQWFGFLPETPTPGTTVSGNPTAATFLIQSTADAGQSYSNRF
ncbi:MAG: DUF1566 domain-containing protein, partial [Methylococcaceae bacterium]